LLFCCDVGGGNVTVSAVGVGRVITTVGAVGVGRVISIVGVVVEEDIISAGKGVNDAKVNSCDSTEDK
jgi:hypothetical protein